MKAHRATEASLYRPGQQQRRHVGMGQLAAACSWDREVAYAMDRVTAREVVADSLHWTFSPVLCLGSDTRWGRVNETFDEDPYLVGEMGAAIIHGYQGDDLADDFLCAFNGGMFGGEAVAKAIFSEINPQGRLPITFPRHSGQLPMYYNHLPGWHGGKYCDLPAEPLFAFGEGMGYSTFAYSDLTIDEATLTASVTVRNNGDRMGVETVQVYMRDLVSSVMTPVKQLIAFRQVELVPGESQRVEFALERENFSLVNWAGQRVVESGALSLMVGHGSRDEDLLCGMLTM